jgi:hypothetical protein
MAFAASAQPAIRLCCLQEAAINHAIGEAETITRKAEATATGIRGIASAITSHGGGDAVSMTVAQQYVEAFGKIAQTGNTIVVPADAGNVSSMVSQATAIFRGMTNSRSGPSGVPSQAASKSPQSPRGSGSSAPGQSEMHTGVRQTQRSKCPDRTSQFATSASNMGDGNKPTSLFSLQADA